MKKDYEEFHTCPEYAQVLGWSKDVNTPILEKEGTGLPMWSGDFPPPQVERDVWLSINNIGRAQVVGYFVEYGWLGVLAVPYNPPDWWIKQNGKPSRKKPSHAFGVEVHPLVKVGYLPQDSYFKTSTSSSAFVYDSEGRFTRLWDGTYVDGFFTNPDETVILLSRDEAVRLAKEYREI